MLGGFHAAKCAEHCIDKYIQGSGIVGSLQQAKVFGVNVVDTVLNGINYKRSFKGYLILAHANEKWDTFLKTIDINQFDGFSDDIKSLHIAFATKTFFEDSNKLFYNTCSSRFELIKQEFGKFSNIWSARSEICKHWRGVLKLISLLKGCEAAVTEGNGEAHFHAMQTHKLPQICILMKLPEE